MKESRARVLLRKFLAGTLSEEERAILESWYLQLARSKKIEISRAELEAGLKGLMPPNIQNERKTQVYRLWVAAAASIVIILVSVAIWFADSTKVANGTGSSSSSEILPGGNRALLTLGSGRSIDLENASNGELAQDGNLSIVKATEGELVYSRIGAPLISGQAGAFNKIETPKAGHYRVVLPDGTKVWLNAASSIRFPAGFSEQDRFVEITGEVFFEVAKLMAADRPVPFRVRALGQDIEVLGTVFNVNSYADEEAVKTTLVEGSIQVRMSNNPSKNVILRPGQQACLISRSNQLSQSPELKVIEVDPSAATAWKEGYFQFNGVSLSELMRQLARWYDLQVTYEGVPGEYEFVGRIERNTELSNVLKVLEFGGVKFKMEKNKIIITP